MTTTPPSAPVEQCEVCKHTVPLNSIDNGVCTRCRDLVGYPEWGDDDPPSGVDALAQNADSEMS